MAGRGVLLAIMANRGRAEQVEQAVPHLSGNIFQAMSETGLGSLLISSVIRTQHIGYDFRCTENCVGASSASVARRAIVNRPASANLAV